MDDGDRRQDAQDAFTRRVRLLYDRGLANLVEYQNAAHGQLDTAIDAFLELERLVKSEGARVSAVLGLNSDSLVNLIAGACLYRYSERRKLLYGDLPADTQRTIRADLDRAIDASEPVAGNAGSSGQRRPGVGHREGAASSGPRGAGPHPGGRSR